MREIAAKMERQLLENLAAWRGKANRKPLILQGARQIGKTWLMKAFGERYFKHTAYFNFDEADELAQIFERTKDVKRILGQLALFTDAPILPQDTLLIFDEIQECNKALNALKYFCEKAPEYAVIAAGSLLGVSLSKGDSFPVGKVDFLKMYPVSFREFLAAESPDMCEYLQQLSRVEELPSTVFNRLHESYRKYQITGGMPEPISLLLDNKGIDSVESVLQNILNAYSLDFSKHAEARDTPKIDAIWKSLPSQLSKENRKFVYKLVKGGARAREYEDALLWLEHAGLIYRVFLNTKPARPLSAYDDNSAFKVYAADVGLLRRLAHLSPEIILSDNVLFTEFKGALSENFVLQSLAPQLDLLPRYWTSEGKAEVDFLLQHGTEIIPVEVKSAHSVAGKSLALYNQTYSPKIRIRYSMNNLKMDGNLLNIPIFLADWTMGLLDGRRKKLY
jgi:predicted AAA+ superfamily ATPase